jgi:hypothetical protein
VSAIKVAATVRAATDEVLMIYQFKAIIITAANACITHAKD